VLVAAALLVSFLAVLALGGCTTASTAGPDCGAVAQAADRLSIWLRENVSHGGCEEDDFLSIMDNLYDWPEIGLARHDGGGFADYLALTERYIRQSWQDPDGFRKATDLERLTLAISAAGGDARDVGGHDLIAALCDHSRFDMQGVNSPIFALIALDCKAYPVPNGVAWTRERMLQSILEYRNGDGSFDLSGSGVGDPDITAMVVQALWRYAGDGEVEQTIEGAVAWLSEAQQDDGGYASWGAVNSESAAQVIIALSCVGVDVTTDPDFSKGGSNPLSFLLEYQNKDGGFCHTLHGGSNKMASEQAMLALDAWLRLRDGQSALYDYVD
jgi:hypothetical protein